MNDYLIHVLAAERTAQLRREADAWRLACSAATLRPPRSVTRPGARLAIALSALTGIGRARHHAAGISAQPQPQPCGC